MEFTLTDFEDICRRASEPAILDIIAGTGLLFHRNSNGITFHRNTVEMLPVSVEDASDIVFASEACQRRFYTEWMHLNR